jgi:hypothetical protein
MSLISEPIIPLGQRVLASSVSYRRNKVLYDYALADLALLTATSKEYPYVRQTAPFRKDQFDNSSNPGEQTLTQWWLRSQSSFHSGAGIMFQEPASDDEVMTSFAESAGIDPWTPGEISLLRQAVLKNASAVDTLVMGAVDGSTDVFFQAEGTALHRETSGGTGAVTWGGSGTIVSLTNDGERYYAADSTGIYRGTLAGGAGSLLWNTGNANVTIAWAKQRLVAGIGPSIYELVTGGPTLPTALYTHPSTAWRWTSIADGSGAIYAAGYNGSESAIYKFVLSTAGVMPTLTSGIVAAKLPVGERVHSIETYLGAYIAIGTNKGVRIGAMAENGDISYGPLVIESTQPVYDLAGRDRFIYATCTNQIGGNSGLWRIDLGTELSDGSFPYATDLQAGLTGTVNSVSVFGASDRMVFGVSGSGSYLESATDLVTSGTLRTGYIRFNTIEPKQFRYVTVRMANANGTVGVETYDRNGSAVSVVTVTEYDNSDYDLGRTTSEEYIALRFTLNRESATVGPTLNSWQVKALPAITRSRLINVPILLFEKMRDSKGAQVPPTDVHAVLSAIEQYEDRAQPVLFTNLNVNPNRSELVVVDEVRYQKVTPPSGQDGDGGIVYLTLRTVQ